MKVPKKAIVSKRVSEQQIIDAQRWNAFVTASGLSFEELSESWLNVFDCQSKPESASVELIRLVDLAIQKDLEKV